MINIFLLLIAFNVVFPNSDFDLAKDFYSIRHLGANGTIASAENIDKAIDHFKIALKVKEFEMESAIFLLKCYYYKGEFVEQDIDKRKNVLNQGKNLGVQYIKKFPEIVDFRYWYLVNLGSWARLYGVFTAAKEGVADQMKNHAEKIISLDPNYANGGGYYMLGAVHYKSPYIPFLLSWPDNNEAIKYLEMSTNIGIPTLTQKNYLAQAMYKDGKIEEAKQILREVINTTPRITDRIEDLNYIEDAQKFLKDFSK